MSVFLRVSGHRTVVCDKPARTERKIKLYCFGRRRKGTNIWLCFLCASQDIFGIWIFYFQFDIQYIWMYLIFWMYFIVFHVLLHQPSLRLVANISALQLCCGWGRGSADTQKCLWGAQPGLRLTAVVFYHITWGLKLPWYGRGDWELCMFDKELEYAWLITAVDLVDKIIARRGSWIKMGDFRGIFRGRARDLIVENNPLETCSET